MKTSLQFNSEEKHFILQMTEVWAVMEAHPIRKRLIADELGYGDLRCIQGHIGHIAFCQCNPVLLDIYEKVSAFLDELDTFQ